MRAAGSGRATRRAHDAGIAGAALSPGEAGSVTGPEALPIVRVAVTGDGVTHRAVCALVALQQTHPDLMAGELVAHAHTCVR